MILIGKCLRIYSWQQKCMNSTVLYVYPNIPYNFSLRNTFLPSLRETKQSHANTDYTRTHILRLLCRYAPRNDRWLKLRLTYYLYYMSVRMQYITCVTIILLSWLLIALAWTTTILSQSLGSFIVVTAPFALLAGVIWFFILAFRQR